MDKDYGKLRVKTIPTGRYVRLPPLPGAVGWRSEKNKNAGTERNNTMSKCCDSETQCETSCSSEDCKPSCESAASDCPIECAADMWKGSFMQAMREAQVEILKAKILKSHGPMMDQAADAFLETAMACWQTQIAQVKKHQAGEAFKSKLLDLWLQDKKK